MRSGGPAVLSLLLPLLAAPFARAAFADDAPAALVARLVPPVPSIVPPAPAASLSPRRAALLAKDTTIRAAYARSELPASARIEVVGDVFVVAQGDASAPFDAAVDLTRRTVAALYAGPFAHRPSQAVNVYVYGTKAGFDHGAERFAIVGHTDEDLLGLYDEYHRTIVVRTDGAGIGSLSHELVHPLIADAIPHAPRWILEGVPALFEVADISPSGDPHFKAHFRLQTLRDALASKKPAVAGAVRLDALFAPGSIPNAKHGPAPGERPLQPLRCAVPPSMTDS